MEGPDSPPYEEVEALCNLVKVRFEVHDLKGSLQRAILAIKANRRFLCA